MSILQVKCGVWQRLSNEVRAIFSGQHSIGLVLPEFCKGVLDERFKLKHCCIACEKRKKGAVS